MLEILNLARRAIACQHDLFVRVVQRIERVEKLFLDALLAREELNVVDQEDVRLAIAFAETNDLIVLNAIDVLVREFFGRHVSNASAFATRGNMMSDRVQQ